MKHTTNEVCEIFGISQTVLRRYAQGASVKRGGRVEWTTPAILDTSDYEQVIENGRAKLYYFDSAIQKIKQKRGVK